MFGLLPLPFMARGLQDKKSLLHLRNELFRDMVLIALTEKGIDADDFEGNNSIYTRCGFIADEAVEVFDKFVDGFVQLEMDIDFLCFFRAILSIKFREVGIWDSSKPVEEMVEEVCKLAREASSCASDYTHRKYDEWDRDAERIEQEQQARTESFNRKQEIKRLKARIENLNDLPKQLGDAQTQLDKLEAEEKAYRESLKTSKQHV